MPTTINAPAQSCYALMPNLTQLDFTGTATSPTDAYELQIFKGAMWQFAANANNAAGTLTATTYRDAGEQGNAYDFRFSNVTNPPDDSAPENVTISVCTTVSLNAPTQSCDVMPPDQTDVDFTGTTNDTTATYELQRQQGANPPVVVAIATNTAGAITVRNGVTPPDSGQTYDYRLVYQGNGNIYSNIQAGVLVQVCPVVPPIPPDPQETNITNIPVKTSITDN